MGILAEKHEEINLNKDSIKKSTLITIIVDAVLLFTLAISLLIYVDVNNKSAFKQNVDNITNIVTSKSKLANSVLHNLNENLTGIAKFINNRQTSEAIEYLTTISDEENEYQLLKYNTEESTSSYFVYDGVSTKLQNGKNTELHYTNTALTISLYNHKLEDGIVSYTQSFSNPIDGFKYYGVFCKVNLLENGIDTKYFVVKLENSLNILDYLKINTESVMLSTAICNYDGKYLACDSGFKGDNFYEYLYTFNNLSADEMNAIRKQVHADEDGVGSFTYKDFKDRNSTFAYVRCDNSANWYIIVSLPQSEFVKPAFIEGVPLLIIIFFGVMFVFNIAHILRIVKKLKISVERERVASLSKSTFLSRMSHEIRTPLNAVMGYITIAQNNLDNREKVDDCIMKTEFSAKHLLSVINDILDIQAIESGKIEIVNSLFNFRSLINSITATFYTLASKKNVVFDVVFDSMIDESIIGDQMRINQILINLLNNAIKFTPENGNVTMRIKQEEVSDNNIIMNFSISDTGIGMSEEQINKIWKPFEQADSTISRKFGGSGLGLTITKTLIDLMKGTIECFSEVGKGSTFTASIPLVKSSEIVYNKNYDFSNLKALIVDDEESTCEYIKVILNHYKVASDVSYTGEDALERIKQSEKSDSKYNLCILDLRLPGINGIETARRIIEKYGNKTPIIILSAYDISDYIDEAKALGINKFLTKPLFKSTLFNLLVSIKYGDLENEEIDLPLNEIPKYDFHGSRILLAEDNDINIEIAVNILSFANIIVDKACNGEEAVKLFEKSQVGYYKAILMDIQMPVLDGYSATEIIRKSNHPSAKTIPIIAMTANAFKQDIYASINAGMNDHISKPIDEKNLFAVLRKYNV